MQGDAVKQAPTIQQRFTQLLAKTHKNRPDPKVLHTIVRRFSSRLVVCETPADALDLYMDAELLPESTTRLIIMREHNIIVNGPLSIDGKACILSGSDRNGRPLIIKVLDPKSKYEILLIVDFLSNFIYVEASVEIENIKLIQTTDRPAAIPEMKDISVTLPNSEVREMRGRRVGEFRAIVMPRFITTVIELVQLPEETIYERVKDIIIALQFIHRLGYVYIHIYNF